MSNSPQGNQNSKNSLLAWTTAALVVGILGSAGSLWLSLGMGLKACPLCLYQRTFLLAAVGALAVGLLTAGRRSSLPLLAALPAVVGGLGVALFHVFLEAGGRLECPAGLLGLGTAPQQSLAVFVALTAATAIPCLSRNRERALTPTALGAALGVVFAWATIASAPPMPGPPDRPYDEPLEVCRPPYRPAAADATSQ